MFDGSRVSVSDKPSLTDADFSSLSRCQELRLCVNHQIYPDCLNISSLIFNLVVYTCLSHVFTNVMDYSFHIMSVCAQKFGWADPLATAPRLNHV